MSPAGYRPPSKVLVVGAGLVGLSCAWSLQEHGIEVSVVDRAAAGSGASFGNAGYVTPALAVPLPEPSMLRYGIRALLSPGSPVRICWAAGYPRASLRQARFLAGLARHCTTAAWRRGMSAFLPLAECAVGAYQRQLSGGVAASLPEADVLACFGHRAEAAGLLHELAELRELAEAAGRRPAVVELLTGAQARERVPQLSGRVAMAVRIAGQRYLTPPDYLAALADSIRRRNGTITGGTPVTSVRRRGDRVVAAGPAGELDADAVVLANGAWLGRLARPHGVRIPLSGGRGYSFTLPCAGPLAAMLYFPPARVAVTPQGGRVRLAGVMEFGPPDAPPRPAATRSIVRGVRPLLDGADWTAPQDEWMGTRPLTTDGVPLAGQTATPGVFVAGGHGMWGVTLGPLTGSLLADQIATGVTPPELRPLNPCR